MAMTRADPSLLTPWAEFYVIVGTAGATLTGLMFVVGTLIAQERRRGSTETVDAFGTPTVMHFCAALVVAGMVTAPWRDLGHLGAALGVCGAAGVGYGGIVTWRARRQQGYRPVLEDWVWHSVLPIAAYAALGGAGVLFRRRPESALFGVGAAAVALLLVGVHNAWDTLTYVAVEEPEQSEAPGDGKDDS